MAKGPDAFPDAADFSTPELFSSRGSEPSAAVEKTRLIRQEAIRRVKALRQEQNVPFDEVQEGATIAAYMGFVRQEMEKGWPAFTKESKEVSLLDRKTQSTGQHEGD